MGSARLRSVLFIVLCLFDTVCSTAEEEYTPQSDDDVPLVFKHFVRVRPDSTRVLLADDETPLEFELTKEPLNLTIAINLTRKCEAYDLLTFKIEDKTAEGERKQFGLHILWRNSETKFEVHQSDRLATTTKLEVDWPDSDTVYLLIGDRGVTAYNGQAPKAVEMCLVSHSETCSFNRTNNRMNLTFTTENDIGCGMYVDIPKLAAVWKVAEKDRPSPTTPTTSTTSRQASPVTNNGTEGNTRTTSENVNGASGSSTAVHTDHTTPHSSGHDEHPPDDAGHLAVIIVLAVIAVVLLVCVALLVVLLLRTRRKQNKSKRDRRAKNAAAGDSTRLLQSVDQTTLTTMSQVTEGSKSTADAPKKPSDRAPKETSKKSGSEAKAKKTRSPSQKDVNQNDEDRRPSKDPLGSNKQPKPSADTANDAAAQNKMASREVSKTAAETSDYRTVPSAKDKA